jgi:riboflavin biosynthesis pyrimidine reductase
VRQIYPVQGQDWPVAPKAGPGPLPDAVAALARLYACPAVSGRPWVRANMVTSTDGAASVDGLSGGLSGPADRMVFTVLRSLADVILVGAGTARVERYRPVAESPIWTALRPGGSQLPRIAIVTGRVDRDSLLLDGPPGSQPPIFITTPVGADDASGSGVAARAEVIATGQHCVEVGQAIATLGGMGYKQILVEGGPSLLAQLTEVNLLDEFCLTISPVLAGGSAGRVVAPRPAKPGSATGPAARLSLAHVLTDDGFLFCRYLRQPMTRSGEE